MNQVTKISNKYKVDPREVSELKNLLGNNLGYLPKFSEWVFKKGTDLKEIKDILDLLKMVKINKPVSSFKSSEELFDYITEVQNKRKLNQIFKSIPSKSRRNVSERIKSAIYNNIDYS